MKNQVVRFDIAAIVVVDIVISRRINKGYELCTSDTPARRMPPARATVSHGSGRRNWWGLALELGIDTHNTAGIRARLLASQQSGWPLTGMNGLRAFALRPVIPF